MAITLRNTATDTGAKSTALTHQEMNDNFKSFMEFTVPTTSAGPYSIQNIYSPKFTITSSDDYITSTSGVESWIYNASYSVAGQETEPRDIAFKSDGTKMYILGNTGNDITEYTLGTAWSLSGTITPGSTFSVGTQEAAPYGLYFKPDGTSFYVVGTTAPEKVYRYNMSTPWTISSGVTFVSSFDCSAQENDPNAIEFSTDGTKMYIIGTSGDDINQYNLSTAWDITTAIFSTTYSISAYATGPEGISFSSDGTKVWVVGSTFNRIAEFTLSTPWSISSASYSGAVNVGLLDTYAVLGSSGIYVNLTQNKAWISDYQNDRVFELSTNIPATKLYGSKWLSEPDFHIENDLLVNRNARINGSLYMPGSAFFGNTDITGTLNVRTAIDLADADTLRFGTSDDAYFVYNGTPNTFELQLEASAVSFIITDNGTTRFTFTKSTGDLTATGNITAVDFNSTSDARLKENLKIIDNPLDKICKLNGYTFNFINDDNKKIKSGVIAQECIDVFPEVVSKSEDHYKVSYDGLIPLLIEAIKEQQKQIEELKAALK